MRGPFYLLRGIRFKVIVRTEDAYHTAPTTGGQCGGTASSGKIQNEIWTGITGDRVSSIPVDTPPSYVVDLTMFETNIPSGFGSYYGSRIRGYLCVPATGDYTFWISSDDHGVLWLSTDDNPANKLKIAYVSGWTYHRQWEKFASQKSPSVPLVAGKQYYIEALFKEAIGGDHVSVGWQLPDGTLERPIPANRLSPFVNDASTVAARTTSEQELYSQINVYPNPVQSGDSKLTIAGYDGIDTFVETYVEITNMTGEIVFAETLRCGGDCSSYLMKLNSKLIPGPIPRHYEDKWQASSKTVIGEVVINACKKHSVGIERHWNKLRVQAGGTLE